MNKHIIETSDFQKRQYAKPQIKVVKIKGAEIICTSGRSLNPYRGYEWPDD